MKLENTIIKKLDNIQGDVTNILVENAKQSKDISQNTKDLKDHIEGVQQNRKSIKHVDQKIEKLQKELDKSKQPLTVKQLVGRVLIVCGGLTAIASMVFTISKAINAIKDMV